MVSIVTNIAALSAQSTLRAASEESISSIARLSSGSAISKPSDDVAGLAIGTRLRTNVDALKAALKNAAQASSLFNVADGAADNIQKMLSRINELANLATSGALDDNARSYLNAEAQALIEHIDLTAKTTNFNQIKLLDGNLYNKSSIDSNTNAVREQGTTTLTVSDLTNSKTITVNGVTFTARTTLLNDGTAEFVASGTAATAAANLVNALNTFNDYRLKGVTYSVSGAAITFKNNTLGLAGNMFSIGNASDTGVLTGWASSGLPAFAPGAITTLGNSTMKVGGLSEANVEVKGSINDNILKNLSTAKATGNISVDGLDTTAIATASNNQITVTGANLKSGAAASTYINVHQVNHGLKNGDIVKTTNGGSLTVDTNLVFADATDYAVTVVDRDNFRITASTPGAGANTGNTASGSSSIFTIDHQININGSTLIFKASPSAANHVQLGATSEATAENLLAYLNKSTDANIASATYSLDATGKGIDVTYKAASTIGNNYYLGSSSSLIALSGLATNINTLQNGLSSGIDTSNITNNEKFIGKIDGFEAHFAGTANRANLTVTVGDYTYTASNVNTKPAADTKIKFVSSTDPDTNLNGGSFTIEFAANKGETVNNEADATKFADRINSAFEGLIFNQRRELLSYKAIGNVSTNSTTHGRLDGTSFEMLTKDFTSREVESFRVESPVNGATSASIFITVNGETFSNRNIPDGLIKAGAILTLTSETNPSNKIFFHNNADIAQDFSTSDRATSFSTAMERAFGLNEGKSSLNFQIGTTTEESIKLSIQGLKTSDLFKDENGKVQNIDISTTNGALNAINVISSAIQKVTSVRANIGALQSRMDKASSIIQTGIQNQDAARGIFLDTDMAAESTKLASAQVKVQAGVAMLAQANMLAQSLLKLLS